MRDDDLPALLRGVADTLRRLALDEELKRRVATDPELFRIARRVAARYVSGETRPEVLAHAATLNAAGSTATVDYMGESARDRDTVEQATEEFLRLVENIASQSLRCSISLDLSHIGSVLDRSLGLTNARRLAKATAAAGLEMVLSMEGHDRTQQIIDDHRSLCEEFEHIGITVQSRLHRTATDLPALLDQPGRIRLVKGAYGTPLELALDRDDAELTAIFDEQAALLLRSGHPCSIATHDLDRLSAAERVIETAQLRGGPYLFEFLSGLGPAQLATMREHGHPTQEYLVYGDEWWLYVCNRLAEDPMRVLLAVQDAAGL